MNDEFKQYHSDYFGYSIYRYYWDLELTRPRALYSCVCRGKLLTASNLSGIKAQVKLRIGGIDE